MRKKSRSKKASTSIFQNPVVIGSIITGIVAIITTWLNVLPNLGSQGSQRTEPAIPASIVGSPASSTPGVPADDPEQTATSTPFLSSDTTTSTFTPTPTQGLPTFNCLSQWWRVDTGRISTPTSTPEVVAATPNPCLVIPELGISVGGGSLIFSQSGLRDEAGIFGISHSLQQDYAIKFRVTTRQLFNAEFWASVSVEQSPTNRESVSVVMIPSTQDNNRLKGTIAVYRNLIKREDKVWDEIDPNNIPGPPFGYDLEFRVAGGSVVVFVNGQKVADEKGIFPGYLFLGYHKKTPAGSILVDVSVAGLSFSASP